MSNTVPRVSVQVVVRNGERYIRHCLNAVRAQTYTPLEVVILDNASTDRTAEIVAAEYPEFRLIRGTTNLGMWPGQEWLMARTTGEYVVGLSVDVMLDSRFIEHAVRVCDLEGDIAAVQGKIYQYTITELLERSEHSLRRDIIDTCGFAMTRGRTVRNVGHGRPDSAEYAGLKTIFGVEGAAPFFRRSALEDCRVNGSIWDPDYFWYSDDIDLAWRMTLLGHRQVFLADAVAWHDRSTTKGSATIPVVGQLKRLALRRAIPLQKRRWGWSNDRFTIIKNDSILNVLRDLPWIVARECAVLGYTVLFEPAVLLEAGRFVRLLPGMLSKRRILMRRTRVSDRQMHHWFT